MTDASYYKPWYLFWVCAVLAHGYMDYSFWRRWQSWKRGRQETAPSGNARQTLKIWLLEVLFQRQILALSFSRWLVHMCIFWGFVCLAGLSLFVFCLGAAGLLGAAGGVRDFFFHGSGYALLKVWGDGSGLCLLAGLLAAGIRRLVLRPRRLITEQTDLALLAYLIWLVLSGFVLEGLRLSQVPAAIAQYSFVGHFFALPWTISPANIGNWLTAAWTVHAFSGIGLLLYLPNSKLLHSLLGPVVIGLNAAGEQQRKDIYWPRIKNCGPTE